MPVSYTHLDVYKRQVPSYNFISGKREYHGHKLKIGQKDVLVMEGIHGLNGTLTNEIPEDAKYRIYVSALNQINLDEHNRIPSSDGRLLRRIVRAVSYTHLDVYKRQVSCRTCRNGTSRRGTE